MPPKKNHNTLSNFVPVNRKFFNHPFWKEERTFSKSEAWLDLIQLARFEESEAKALIGGKMITWSIGQLPASLRYLAERWKWSKNKVGDFMDLLEKEHMISRLGEAGQTIVSLKNFETYNKKGQQKGQQKGHQKGQLSDYTSGGSEDEGDSKKDTEKDSKKDERGTGEGQARDKTKTVNTEKDCIGINATTYPPDDELKYKAFTDWIKNNAANVSKMKEPFTIDQYLQLRKKIPSREQVQSLILKMHNWAPLLKKNNSAYLTLLNWSKNEFNSDASGTQTTKLAVA